MTDRYALFIKLSGIRRRFSMNAEDDNALTISEAMSALSDQWPRKLTLQGARYREMCWLERRTKDDVIPCMVRNYGSNEKETIFYLGAVPTTEYIEDYGREWRCWSHKPDRKQRETEKWL